MTARSQPETDPAPVFEAIFWGVRGSIPVPGPETVRYGGNTACVEIRCGAERLIFDAGTGLRPLGDFYRASDQNQPIDIFLTHCHHDHVGGFPFFAPLYLGDAEIRLWSGHLRPGRVIRDVMSSLMADPFHPVPLATVPATVSYMDFEMGETLRPHPDIAIRTTALNHPNGAVGYRVDFAGSSICYITDTEHYQDRLDDNIVRLIAGADIVIYDAMFLPEEHPPHVGWGHSTWEVGVRLVEAAGADTLILFHHAPERTDDDLDRLASVVEQARPGTLIAREGMVVRPFGRSPPLDGRSIADRL